MKTTIKYAVFSLGIGTLIAGVKCAAFVLTGSSAIFSDAMESMVNVTAAAFSLYSLVQAGKDPDPAHPYGHGRWEYLSAGFEGGLISLAGALIMYRSVVQVFQGVTIHAIDHGIALEAVGAVMNLGLGLLLIRGGRMNHSAALTADGKHVISDVITTAGVLVGLGLVWVTGWSILDPIVAGLSAGWILVSGWRIVMRSVARLLDTPDPKTLQAVARAVVESRSPHFINLHRLRLRESGRNVQLDFHAVVPRYLPLEILHSAETKLAFQMADKLDRPVDLIVHFDPCSDEQCSTCPVINCPVRHEPQTGEIGWEPGDLIQRFADQVEHVR